jgi:hypothetical protein
MTLKRKLLLSLGLLLIIAGIAIIIVVYWPVPSFNRACTENNYRKTVTVEVQIRSNGTCYASKTNPEDFFCFIHIKDRFDNGLIALYQPPEYQQSITPFMTEDLPPDWLEERLCSEMQICPNGFTQTWFRISGYCLPPRETPLEAFRVWDFTIQGDFTPLR